MAFKLVSKGERYAEDPRKTKPDEEIELDYVTEYAIDLATPQTSLAKSYEIKNDLKITLQVPKSDYQNKNFQNILKWADLPVQHDDYYRDLAVTHKLAGENYRTVLFTHARITTSIHTRTDTKSDFVTVEIFAKQKEDQFVGVVLGEDLESTYAEARKNVENPPLLNVIVPVVNKDNRQYYPNAQQLTIVIQIDDVVISKYKGKITNGVIYWEDISTRDPYSAGSLYRDISTFTSFGYAIKSQSATEIVLNRDTKLLAENLRPKIKIIKIAVLEDMENAPDFSYPNCSFQIQYEIVTALGKNEEIRIQWEKSSSKDNLRLAETEIICKKDKKIYTETIGYHKIDNSIYNGEYGSINVYLNLYGRREQIKKDMPLFETGRPKEFQFRYEYANPKYNYVVQSEYGNFRGTRTKNINNKELKAIVDENLNKGLAIAKFFGEKLIGIVDKTGLYSTYKKIKGYADLGVKVYGTTTTGTQDSALTFIFDYFRVNKWMQYKDRKSKKYINAYSLQRVNVFEKMNVGDSMRSQFDETIICSAYNYYNKDYYTVTEANLKDEKNTYGDRMLSQWRFNMQQYSQDRNFGVPGERVSISNSIIGSTVNEIMGGAVTKADTLLLIYEYDPYITYCQEPDLMAEHDPPYEHTDHLKKNGMTESDIINEPY